MNLLGPEETQEHWILLLYTHRLLLHLANHLSLYTTQHYPRISSLRSWLNLSISWPEPSTTLRKLEHREHKWLERDLTHLNQRATTGISLDTENYLLAKQKISVLEQHDLEAVKIRAKGCFTEEGEKSATGIYFYSLEKKKQADKSIQTLTKENLYTITSTHDTLIETLAFYKQLCEFSSTFLSLNSQQSCEDPFSAP